MVYTINRMVNHKNNFMIKNGTLYRKVVLISHKNNFYLLEVQVYKPL